MGVLPRTRSRRVTCTPALRAPAWTLLCGRRGGKHMAMAHATVDRGGPGDAPGEALPVSAKLVVVAGADEGAEIALDSVIELGTDPSTCRLVLTDPAVSRRHVAF